MKNDFTPEPLSKPKRCGKVEINEISAHILHTPRYLLLITKIRPNSFIKGFNFSTLERFKGVILSSSKIEI